MKVTTETVDDPIINVRKERGREANENLLLGLRPVATDRGDVELVITAFLAIQDSERSQLGHPLFLQDDFERRLAVMLVCDAERANFRSQGADLRRDLDQSFVLLDQAMISALEALQIQSWHCEHTRDMTNQHLCEIRRLSVLRVEVKKNRARELSFQFRHFYRVSRQPKLLTFLAGAYSWFFTSFFLNEDGCPDFATLSRDE